MAIKIQPFQWIDVKSRIHPVFYLSFSTYSIHADFFQKEIFINDKIKKGKKKELTKEKGVDRI
ncbi:hypothetical protein ACVRXF_03915 [Streptococcus orisasini]